jgi:ABC-type proline/glycine betaine transport system permease subunit
MSDKIKNFIKLLLKNIFIGLYFITIIPLILIAMVGVPLGLVSHFYYGKSYSVIVDEFFNVFKVIGTIYVVGLVVTAAGMYFKYLIETASENKNGKLFHFFEILYGICIFIIIVSIALFSLFGIGRLYKESSILFIIVLLSGTFCGYYWFKKNIPK